MSSVETIFAEAPVRIQALNFAPQAVYAFILLFFALEAVLILRIVPSFPACFARMSLSHAVITQCVTRVRAAIITVGALRILVASSRQSRSTIVTLILPMFQFHLCATLAQFEFLPVSKFASVT